MRWETHATKTESKSYSIHKVIHIPVYEPISNEHVHLFKEFFVK